MGERSRRFAPFVGPRVLIGWPIRRLRWKGHRKTARGLVADADTGRMLSRPAVLAFAALIIFLLCARLGTHLLGVSFYVAVSDIVSVANFPFYVGIVSQVGLGLWTAAVAVATMAWALGRTGGAASADFFRDSALLGAAFLVDDALLVHEAIAPTVGIPEEAVLAALGIAAVAWAIRHRAHIRTSANVPLLVTVAFGVLSVALDVLQSQWQLPEHNLLEDGAKFLAIGGWLIYISGEAFRTLSARTG